MHKYDTHVHTSETSPCGIIEAQEVVRLYKDAGYDGIVITDHYYDSFFEKLGEMPWKDKVDIYLQGYCSAFDEGTNIGLTVLLGMEIRFEENPSDYLVYGITEDFLKKYPKLYKLGIKKFRQLIEDEYMLIFQAHPYRRTMVVADPQDIHGVEVFNGNPRHNSHNDKALLYAKENGLMMSSGSDFHQKEDLARGGIIITQEITTSKDLLKALSENIDENLIYTAEND